jgi:hypothetical protein
VPPIQLIQKTLSVIPSPIGRIPYSIAFDALQWLARHYSHGSFELWARNSFLTSAFVPGYSDLDLTVYFHKTPRTSETAQLKKSLLKFKAIFPALGEINAYDPFLSSLASEFANPYDLERDPLLCKRLISRRARDPLVAGVFILRGLDSDAESLLKSPARRLPKWRAHFAAVGAACPPQEPELLYDAVLDLAVSKVGGIAEMKPALKHYYTLSKEERIHGPAGLRNSMYLVFPNKYCFLADHVESVREDSQRELILEQARWEIGGIGSQVLLSDRRPDILEHIRRMIRFLRLRVRDSEKEQDGLRRLDEYVSSLD